jgi:hypothetical protein
VVTLARAGLVDEIAPSLERDGSADTRILAAGFLSATPELTRRMRPALLEGLSDPSSDVAVACAEALADVGDGGAIERGLEMLGDPAPGSLRGGLRILRAAMAREEALARRVLERLQGLAEDAGRRSLEERAPFLQAIGQVPLAAAARYLLDRADEAEGTLQDQPAERWIMLQAGNVGEPGLDVLLERLDGETDPLRRVDLVEALTMRGGDRARDAVLARVGEGEGTPYEILYAADRLVRMGPAARVAPVLKRATLRIEQPDVRAALQCLLWASYPGPR